MKANQIKITDVSVMSGKNIHSLKPVVKMTVDIGEYGDIPTKDIPRFNERLLALFPGLCKNYCSLGYEGGFLERLREGTYLAHVLEHTILEMQHMLGYDVRYGKTRTVTAPSLYYLAFEYQNEVCAQECAKTAVHIFNTLLSDGDIEIGGLLDYLRRVSLDWELGPSTEAIVEAAKRRGIPVTRIGGESLVRLGYGRNSRLVESTLTDATACVCADISCNKELSKYLLREQRIPVPEGRAVYSEISALMAAGQLGLPVVIKPLDSNQGKGVSLNLSHCQEIRDAYNCAARYSSGVIVEQFVKGDDYRVLVVGDAVKAVSKRIPAFVTGDGVHTIRQLVELKNADPLRGDKHEKPLTKIRLDDTALRILDKAGLTPESVLEGGQTVYLRENGNISTGGTAMDCTELIHPENAELAVRAASAIGIDIAGIDIVTEDISKPILETGGVVVEVNAAPGIRMHLFPSEGRPRAVGDDIVRFLFPTAASADFPIVSVTGTNGKTTVARLIQHTLLLTGKTVGLTSTAGTFIGRKCISRGDNAGPASARALLANKSIDAAVLETARGGIIRGGLGYDLADVGVITNITGDHLGLDGIETLSDLVFVKSLVAEAVKENGHVVLNAYDPSTPAILERTRARPILFGRDLKQFRTHRLDSVSVYLDKGWLRIRDGARVMNVMHVSEIPITLGGVLDCNIENALTAAGALYGLKVPPETIKAGFASFTDNDGRFELYELDGKWVMLDYGHNPAGYETVIRACAKLRHKKLIGVIGMPGDRRAADVKDVGQLCAGAFDRLYVKEDEEKRSMESGEMTRLLRDAALKAGFPREELICVEKEREAMLRAVGEADEGDLIVVFYEKAAPLRSCLVELGAKKFVPTADRTAAARM
jgi:cyanophycin synthetase